MQLKLTEYARTVLNLIFLYYGLLYYFHWIRFHLAVRRFHYD